MNLKITLSVVAYFLLALALCASDKPNSLTRNGLEKVSITWQEEGKPSFFKEYNLTFLFIENAPLELNISTATFDLDSPKAIEKHSSRFTTQDWLAWNGLHSALKDNTIFMVSKTANQRSTYIQFKFTYKDRESIEDYRFNGYTPFLDEFISSHWKGIVNDNLEHYKIGMH